MKKPAPLALFLAFALVASNAWWVYRTIDLGVTHAYQSASLEETQQALSQALAIIKSSSVPNATRAQIIEAAQKAWPSTEPFEKDGYLWVGRLGLRFDKSGRLIEAVSG